MSKGICVVAMLGVGLALGCAKKAEPTSDWENSVQVKGGLTVLRPLPPIAQVGDPVSYATVVKILTVRCQACHVGKVGGKKKIGGSFRMNGYENLIKGGVHGEAIKVGDGEGSLIVQYMRGKQKPAMPFTGRPIADSDIKLISDWIIAGAKGDDKVPNVGAQQYEVHDAPVSEDK